MKALVFGLSLLIGLVASSTVSAQKADDVVGVWKTQNGKSHIKIFKKGTKYYGKIIWLQEPNNEDGNAKKDKNNPEESLQSRPLMGMELLTGFSFDGDDEWEDGKIYDPESGKTYSCVMVLDEGELEVTGYVGFSWIGRTVRWTRVK
ncbi:MAG: DUF2147 domain-containing protein [Salibacteraceae bacterium]